MSVGAKSEGATNVARKRLDKLEEELRKLDSNLDVEDNTLRIR